MVIINKIYTRTGDDGTTGLVGGTRISKTSLRVTAYGEVDELNSFVGVARTEAVTLGNLVAAGALETAQQRLFDIGAELACPEGKVLTGMTPFAASHAEQLEQAIDRASDGLSVLRSFVLPGGTRLNAALHVARAVCRRVERQVLILSEQENVSKDILIYLNRLSDFLFALARRASFDEGKPEFLWTR